MLRQTLGAAVLLWVLLFLPALLFVPRQTEEEHPLLSAEQTFGSAPSVEAASDAAHTLRLWRDGAAEELSVEEYLQGVLRGEMPAAFHMEALKAQTVAERTYLYYQMAAGAKPSHPQADVCTDPACCTAYLTEEAAREKWGTAFEACNEKILKAVSATDGQVMYYGGEPLMAVFHSSSAGVTATSGEVWTADLPYLVSVESPESADTVPNYYSVNTFAAAEFREKVSSHYPAAKWGETAKDWVSDVVRTDTGRVESVTIGGVEVSGQDLRRIFSLRSTSFTIEAGEGDITFRVTGYGHGVGMSQLGAVAMAKKGESFYSILSAYYPGTVIGII